MFVSITDQYMAFEMIHVGSSELSIGGIYVIRIMEDMQALYDFSITPEKSYIWYLQQSKAKYNPKADLLSSGHAELDDKWDGQCVSHDVRCNIHCRIREIKGIDIDAGLVCGWDSDVVGCRNGLALEYAGKDVGSSLAANNSHHDEGYPS